MTYEELQERYIYAKEKFERDQFRNEQLNNMNSFFTEANRVMRRILNKSAASAD